MPVRRVIAVITAAAVLIGAGSAAVAVAGSVNGTSARSTSVNYRDLAVTGYVEAQGTSVATLKKRSAKLTSVGIDGINFTADGSGITDVTPEAYALLAQAHRQKDTAELLVGNYDNDFGDFSPQVAAALLSSPTNMEATANALVTEVAEHGWDGIQVDLESLESIVDADPSYTDAVTSYLALLRTKLDDVSTKKTLSVAIMATTGNYRDLGYDPAGIAASTTSIVLMAYDQHGPWERTAGPVGGLPWVRATLRTLLKSVDASEVQLGIAGYGYSWPRGGAGRHYSPHAARALAAKDKAVVHWSGTQQERYATLKNGTRLWWSDARSVDARVKLAASFDLRGVAVWSIGLADTLD